MTEAGRKWIERCKFGEEGVGYAEDYSFLEKMEQEAEFWLRAFCDEVERRAKPVIDERPIELFHSRCICLGWAFMELKRELLDDTSK